MRLAATISLFVVSPFMACSTSTSAERWRDIQSQRLQRAHMPMTGKEAVDKSLELAPYYQHSLAWASRRIQQPDRSQDPKLDQRMPGGPASGPRRFRYAWQPFSATLDYGVGDVMFRADGTRLDGRADADFARLRIDSGTGAALHVDWSSSEGQLFDDIFINDGVDAKSAQAQLGGVDVFPHLRFDHEVGDWRIPLRVGLFADWQKLDHQQALVEREWLSFGPRLMLEPTWDLLAGQDLSLSLVTRLGGNAGAAWFCEEFRNGDDRDVLARVGGEVGAGLRAQSGDWSLEVGYRLRHTLYGETQSDLFGDVSDTEMQQRQVFISFGVNF